MNKKPKRSDKNHIKNAQFSDRNLSSLAAHPREGTKLRSPYSALKNLHFARPWVDDCIPNILWACVLAAGMEREDYLRLFRLVVSSARENLPAADELHVTHNFLATATDEEFDTMFRDVLGDQGALKHLSALLFVESLPDLHHWKRHLEKRDPGESFAILAGAVSESFDHQSQVATDIRWLKLMSQIIVRQKVFFGLQFDEFLEQLRLYPNYGEMEKVRPAIRAMEVGLRENEFPSDGEAKDGPKVARVLPSLHSETFWKEMRSATQCLPMDVAEKPRPGNQEVAGEIVDILRDLSNHFDDTETTTAVDARHDGAFGIVGYALHLMVHAASNSTHCRAEGRIVFRTIVETFITFSYLAKKDDPTIWLQYRSAGAGQAKLAFLKNIREEQAPEFVDLSLLEVLANEDRWMEYQDISTGHWANLNLRKIAEEAGVKDAYDRYYDWTSNYTHGQWGAVRDAALTTCANPLHRFHRIPSFLKGNMPSIIPDACKLLNRMLDQLNMLYPSFKPRIKGHRSEVVSAIDPTTTESETVSDMG